MSVELAMERVRRLVWNISNYSNSRIVEVAKGFVDTSKESPTLAGECHKTYRECLEGAYSAREARRCLALLYICNEIVTMAPDDESWRTVLSGAMVKYVPLVCDLALRQQEYNVVLNVMRLPAVWKAQGLFDAEACEEMKALCDIHHRYTCMREYLCVYACVPVYLSIYLSIFKPAGSC